MEITESKQDNTAILQLKGRLDVTTTPDLEKKITDMLEAGEKNFLIDMESLDYISSAGLRIFLVLLKKTKAISGKVVLCALQEHVHEVFEVSGFTSIFTICSDVDEGLSG